MKTRYPKFAQFKRRKKGKTDYNLRLRLLKSNLHRFVIRKTLNNVNIQLIKYEPNGDKIVLESTTKQLRKYGWKTHLGNIPSSYLTGYIAGLKARKMGISTDEVKEAAWKGVAFGCASAMMFRMEASKLLRDDEGAQG